MSCATEAEIKLAREEAKERLVMDVGKGVDLEKAMRRKTVGELGEIVLCRIMGWEHLPEGQREPDAKSPYGTVEIKTRGPYYNPIELRSRPDVAVLCHYYYLDRKHFIAWVKNYTRDYFEQSERSKEGEWQIHISRGDWATRSKKHTPISPSCFSDLPLQR